MAEGHPGPALQPGHAQPAGDPRGAVPQLAVGQALATQFDHGLGVGAVSDMPL